ncbi:MAG: hypothetical protein GWN39_07115, partial [Thermoplasmata archaeon]|nr:hypothetical protein [Thermoplasmata archaeon]NIS11855.1 hypothetical protein [Thermoplasmata archaeon]NIV78517.1 hypothetical protein [Thermoplasmata archaeon]NIW88558.1 hypothetical protein [Thermoplasmata archaeon]
MLYNVTVGTRSSTGDTIDLSLTGTHASWGTLVGQTYIVLSAKGSDKVQVKVVPPAGT